MTLQRKKHFGHLVLASVSCCPPELAQQGGQEEEISCKACFQFTGQQQVVYTVSDSSHFKCDFKAHGKGCGYI